MHSIVTAQNSQELGHVVLGPQTRVMNVRFENWRMLLSAISSEQKQAHIRKA